MWPWVGLVHAQSRGQVSTYSCLVQELDWDSDCARHIGDLWFLGFLGGSFANARRPRLWEGCVEGSVNSRYRFVRAGVGANSDSVFGR
jgi:hypothetical protein